jgi:hypothetical protein
MDWGLERYRVDLDYVKVDIVDPATAGPDEGAAVPYHPPLADPAGFAHEVRVAQDSTLDLDNPCVAGAETCLSCCGRKLSAELRSNERR